MRGIHSERFYHTIYLFCRAPARGFFGSMPWSRSLSWISYQMPHFSGSHRFVLDRHLVHVKRARVWPNARIFPEVAAAAGNSLTAKRCRGFKVFSTIQLSLLCWTGLDWTVILLKHQRCIYLPVTSFCLLLATPFVNARR